MLVVMQGKYYEVELTKIISHIQVPGTKNEC